MGADRNITIGVLALQGAIKLHRPHIEAAEATYVEVSHPQTLRDIDGLILPGGESGVMLKLIDIVKMNDLLSLFFRSKPVWGICAGAILMAKSVVHPTQRSFGVIDIDVERNAYGRQLDSMEMLIDDYQVSYIRAPRIQRVGRDVRVLKMRDQDPVWVETDRIMVTTFHPEINKEAPSPWHQRFVQRCLALR